MAKTLLIICTLLLLLAAELPVMSAPNDWQSTIHSDDDAIRSSNALAGASPLLDSITVSANVRDHIEQDQVPEPGALLSFATGLIGLVGLMMRRVPRLRP